MPICGYGLGMFAALLPLQTLPSWPEVVEPTLLEMLTLTVFIPLAITAVLTVVVLGKGWRSEH